ncbi:MAG TPA: histidine kinase [Candidatus Limnocylindrales bacterium]|nr:histidine kinase [Candidatus Limnocylindrales bacterium]
MRRGWVRLAIAVVGTILAVVGASIVYGSGAAASAAIVDVAICLAYLYGGLVIWAREPGNRTGPLMIAIGLTWHILAWYSTGIPVLMEIGIALGDTSTALLLILVLSYPTGRFERTSDRLAAIGLAVGITLLNVIQVVPSPIWINENPNGYFVGMALIITAIVLTLRRWATAPRRSRRELLPILVAGAVLTITILLNSIRRISDLPDDVGAIVLAVKDIAPAAIPIALLIGFYRQSEHRLRGLVDAIPDRMIRFTRDGQYLEPRRGGEPVVAADPQVARQLHELMFAEAGDLALSSAAKALDSGTLQSFDFAVDQPNGRRELEARVAPSGPDEVTAIVRDFTDQRAAEAELRHSRTRIVEATDAERRRLERDLHDGAQQRLVSLSLALRLLRSRLDAGDEANDGAIAAADEAAAELRVAIKELRELARGIHPAILTEAGLGPAIVALADRSTVPAVVGALPDRRLTAAVEATAYFVVSEALANVAKYASATKASIGAECGRSTLRVEVGDDGVGGADQARGTGLRGLQDRVAAHGGRLTIDSPPGQGTLVVAEIPLT